MSDFDSLLEKYDLDLSKKPEEEESEFDRLMRTYDSGEFDQPEPTEFDNQLSQYDIQPEEETSNLERLGTRLETMGTKAEFGMGEMAARQDPSAKSLIQEYAEKFDDGGIPSIWDIVSPYLNFETSRAVKGLVDIADTVVEGDVREKMIEANKLVSEEANQILGDPNMQYTGNEAQKIGWEIAEGAANMIPALALGAATKNPGTALGFMSMQVSGTTYSDYMDKTGDHNMAMGAAKFHALAEVIPETIPVTAILKPAVKGQALNRFIEATFGEGAQEMITEVLQGSYDRVQLENMSLSDALKNIDWADVWHAGLIGFGVGGVLSTPGTIADIMAKPEDQYPDIGGEVKPIEENMTAIEEELANTPVMPAEPLETTTVPDAIGEALQGVPTQFADVPRETIEAEEFIPEEIELATPQEQIEEIDILSPEAMAEEEKLTKEAETRRKKSESAKERTRKSQQLDPENDDVVTYIRKLGGINVDIESDVRDRLKGLPQSGKRVGLPAIEQTGGKGLTLDEIGEHLIADGYLKPDPNIGNGVDKDAVIELLWNAESEPQYSVQGQAKKAAEMEESEDEMDARIKHLEQLEMQDELESLKKDIAAPTEDEMNEQLRFASLMDRAYEIDEQRTEDILSKDTTDEEAINELRSVIADSKAETAEQTAVDTISREEDAQPAQAEPTESVEIQGKRFVKPKRARDEQIVMLDAKALEDNWKRSTGFYISPGPEYKNQIGQRIKGFEQFYDQNEQIEVAEVGINERTGIIGFTNGRHRTRVLLDKGYQQIPVSMPAEDVQKAKDLELLAYDMFDQPQQAAEPFELTDEVSTVQQVKDLEIQKDQKRSPDKEVAAAQAPDDLFAGGQLEPDLFAEAPVAETKPGEDVRQRVRDKLKGMSLKNMRDMAREVGVKQKGAKPELAERIAIAREAIDAVSQYDSEQEFYNAVYTGKIDQDQLAEWTGTLSAKTLTPNPMAIEPNMRQVFAMASRALGGKAPTPISEAEKKASEKKVRKQNKKKRDEAFPKKEPLDFTESIQKLQEINTYEEYDFANIDEKLYTAAVSAINEQVGVINDYGYDLDRIRETPHTQLPDTLGDAQKRITEIGSGLVPIDSNLESVKQGRKNIRPEVIYNRLANYLVDVGLVEGGAGSGERTRAYVTENYPELEQLLQNLDAQPDSIENIAKDKEKRKEKREALAGMLAEDEWGELVDAHTGLFKNPEGMVEAAKLAKETGYIPPEQAEKIIQQWKDQVKELAKNDAFHENVRDKVILSLFDASGEWAKPWIEAGYDVRMIDLKVDDVDVMDMDRQWFEDYDMTLVHGVLAACPCTDFSMAGTRDWKPGPSSRVEGGKDYTGKTHASIDLVNHTLDIIDYLVPQFYAIENPVGRIAKITDIPDARLRFHPHHYGAPWTKETDIFGKFNPNLPQANVKPTQGSRTWNLGSSQEKKGGERSLTPEGFAYAFFIANNDFAMPGYEVAAQDYVDAMPKMYTDAQKAQAKLGYMYGTQQWDYDTMDMGDSYTPKSGQVFEPHVLEAIETGYYEAQYEWRIEMSPKMPYLDKRAIEDMLNTESGAQSIADEVRSINKKKGAKTRWDAQPVSKLKKMLKDAGLVQSGKKSDLIERLKNWEKTYTQATSLYAKDSNLFFYKPMTKKTMNAKAVEENLFDSRDAWMAKDKKGIESLEDIELTTEDGEITQTAEWWLDDVDSRIKEVNKLRDCI